MDKRFWAVVGIIIIGFSGILFINNRSKDTAVSGTTSHYAGSSSSSSKVMLLEYGDYECPVCGTFFPVTQKVKETYGSKVRFQFRNLPLSTIHQNAFAAARAAEAADLQGKFWQMHDLLYQNQDPYGKTGWVASKDVLNQYFGGFAQQLGLNVTQFKADFASSKVNNRINADLQAFEATGDAMATPTFYLNGKKVDNNQLFELDKNGQQVPSFAKFSKVLDKALAETK